MSEEINLPYNWTPRPHQREVFEYFFGDLRNPTWPERKRADSVWHRRSGKDSSALNLTALAAHMRVGTYWHMLPTLNQARKVIWDGIDKQGRRIIDQAFPPEIRESTNESDMKIKFKKGSVWQLVGSDNYDSLIGANPIGVIFSEWSVADPRAWDFVRPILLENGGFAWFIYTPRGKNHGYKMYEMALNNGKWHASLLTVADTHFDDGSRIIGDELIQEERDSGMAEDMIQQEYYCSFDTGLVGAYYTAEMKRAEAEGRIGDFPWMPEELAVSVWDLGMRDDNFIIYAQPDGDMVRIIDCDFSRGRGLPNYIKDVREKRYIYERHWAPKDIHVRDYTGTGEERIEVARQLGIDFDEVPDMSLQDGIESARRFISRCKFNEKTCGPLIDAMFNYRREYDDKRQEYRDKPLHDWACHGADTFRYTSVSWHLNRFDNPIMRRGRNVRPPTVISHRGKIARPTHQEVHNYGKSKGQETLLPHEKAYPS